MKPEVYTVKSLSKLSNVSVRTLHYYDEIGLLKPAFLGANQYRYYTYEQLLSLQQILFLKELGLELRVIKELLPQDKASKISALISQKVVLKKEMARLRTLLKTIDKTILNLKGDITMSKEELFYGLNSSRQKEYEEYILERYGETAQKLIDESHQKSKKLSEQDLKSIREEGTFWHKKMADFMIQKKAVSSKEVQEHMKKHFGMLQKFYNPTKEVYLGLGDLYNEHPDFKKFFNSFAPGLAGYVRAAMQWYAQESL